MPIYETFKECDDLNSSFVVEPNDLTDTNFLYISETCTSFAALIPSFHDVCRSSVFEIKQKASCSSKYMYCLLSSKD